MIFKVPTCIIVYLYTYPLKKLFLENCSKKIFHNLVDTLEKKLRHGSCQTPTQQTTHTTPRHAQTDERVARTHAKKTPKYCWRFRPFKTPSEFTKYRACDGKFPPKPPLKSRRLPTRWKCHACHTDAKVSGVLRLSRQATFQTSKCPENTTPATEMDIAQKSSAARR